MRRIVDLTKNPRIFTKYIQALLSVCRDRLPAFMVPARIIEHKGSPPRNPNGKIDRKALAQGFESLYAEQT